MLVSSLVSSKDALSCTISQSLFFIFADFVLESTPYYTEGIVLYEMNRCSFARMGSSAPWLDISDGAELF